MFRVLTTDDILEVVWAVYLQYMPESFFLSDAELCQGTEDYPAMIQMYRFLFIF